METEVRNSSKEMLIKLAKLQADINYIKDHMVDVDTILTKEEEIRLEEGLNELKEGKTTAHHKLKKELGF